MQLIHSLQQLAKLNAPCVATIGSFDAIHLGHQAIIARVKQLAAKWHIASTVLLFEPQPLEFFSPETAPPRALRLRDKIVELRRLGIDYVVCLKFTSALANITAAAFVEQVIVNSLHAKHLVIGDDFQFGKNRAGDFNYLIAQGKKRHFSVESMPTIVRDGRRVSSTWVRESLQIGDFDLVKTLLNRPYQLHGKVRYCDRRGHLIGFPTANIKLERNMALRGVCVVKIDGLKHCHNGVANLGCRPTVDGLNRMLEVHIFDFDQDIYGQHLSVQFLCYLRPEKKFDCFDDLKAQIAQDVIMAKQYLSSRA